MTNMETQARLEVAARLALTAYLVSLGLTEDHAEEMAYDVLGELEEDLV